MHINNLVHNELQSFTDVVKEKINQLFSGEPEDQLRDIFDNLLKSVARDSRNKKAVCTGETPLPDRLRGSDSAAHLYQLITGFLLINATRVGTNYDLALPSFLYFRAF